MPFGLAAGGPARVGSTGLLLLLLTACAAPHYRAIQQAPGELPQQAAVAGVPFIAQEDNYCGPAALAMLLNWTGQDIDQDAVAEQVYTPGRAGTLPADLLTGARRNGVLAVQVASLRDMLAEIAAGHPVLVFQNLGLSIWPQWHFAVAIAYDLERDVIILHSGTRAHHVTDLNAFERTWERADYWAITVTTPDDLPVAAADNAILAGAAGLERAGQLQAALTAYEAIIRRWPNNSAAYMGMGNSYYSLERYREAIERFRAALKIKPEYAPAWNNLAYSLHADGQQQAALQAARQAVRFGQADAANYRQTLQEIEAATP